MSFSSNHHHQIESSRDDDEYDVGGYGEEEEDGDYRNDDRDRERVLLPDCGTLAAPSPAIEMKLMHEKRRDSPPMPPPRSHEQQGRLMASTSLEKVEVGDHHPLTVMSTPASTSSATTTSTSSSSSLSTPPALPSSIRFDPLSLRFWATSGPFLVALGIAGYVYYVFNFIVCVDVLLNNHGKFEHPSLLPSFSLV